MGPWGSRRRCWPPSSAWSHRRPSHTLSAVVLSWSFNAIHCGLNPTRVSGARDHRPPSQSSKMVLASVHGGGPILTIDRTVFEMWLGSL